MFDVRRALRNYILKSKLAANKFALKLKQITSILDFGYLLLLGCNPKRTVVHKEIANS